MVHQPLFLKKLAALCKWTKQAVHGKYQHRALLPFYQVRKRLMRHARNEGNKISKLHSNKPQKTPV
jgi:hypothetical protein